MVTLVSNIKNTSIKIYFILMLLAINSFGKDLIFENFPYKAKYLSVGFGNYPSDVIKSDGFEFMMDIGVQTDNSKIYLTLDNIFFEKSTQEIDLLMYSLNYDAIYKKFSYIRPYIGAGINYIDISDKEKKLDKRLGANAKAGGLIEINRRFDINFGLKYIYTNTDIVDNLYGTFVNFEFKFF